jgi:hypothetical protein
MAAAYMAARWGDFSFSQSINQSINQSIKKSKNQKIKKSKNLLKRLCNANIGASSSFRPLSRISN